MMLREGRFLGWLRQITSGIGDSGCSCASSWLLYHSSCSIINCYLCELEVPCDS